MPNASFSYLNGINNAGTVVGGYTINGVAHGLIANPGSGNFSTIDYPGATNTYLYTINNYGVATGKYTTGQTTGWFTVNSLGNFTNVSVSSQYVLYGIYGINDDGAISAHVNMANEPGPGWFAILNPDGSMTRLNTPVSEEVDNEPGAINTTPLVAESDDTQGDSLLVNASGNVTQVLYPYPQVPGTPLYAGHAYAFGLNNPGMVLGYFTTGLVGGEAPYTGFTRDSSGNYSEVFCPNLANSGMLWNNPNDNGVLVASTLTPGVQIPASGGGGAANISYIATPIAGEPQVALSPTSLIFPPTPVGHTTAPQTVTLTNTGNARLDIGGIHSTSTVFSFSGCLNPSNYTTSLDPGANCTMTVTATPSTPGPTSMDVGDIDVDDSAPGAPHVIPVSVIGSTPAPPSCQLTFTNAGPPPQVTFAAQDTNTGLKSIALVSSTNASVNIPSFPSGTMNVVNLIAMQVNAGESSSVEFSVTNVGGSSTTCGSSFAGSSAGWIGLGGSFMGVPAVTPDHDGQLEVLTENTDNSLGDIAQISPTGWSGWQSLGAYLVTRPSVATNSGGVPEAFIRCGDGSVWHIARVPGEANWTAWSSLGGTVLTGPTAAANADGRLDVFGLGTDHSLWHTSETSPGGSWSGWSSLGGSMAGTPVVAQNADGRLEVFVRGTDGTIWHIWQTAPGGPWSGWVSLLGMTAADPAVAANTDGVLQAFMVQPDGTVWSSQQITAGSQEWTGWIGLGGGNATGNAAAAVNSDGQMEVFFRGTDNTLWHDLELSGSGTWSGWSSLGGNLADSVAVESNANGDLAVFGRAPDNTLWMLTQSSPGNWPLTPTGGADESATRPFGRVPTLQPGTTEGLQGRIAGR